MLFGNSDIVHPEIVNHILRGFPGSRLLQLKRDDHSQSARSKVSVNILQHQQLPHRCSIEQSIGINACGNFGTDRPSWSYRSSSPCPAITFGRGPIPYADSRITLEALPEPLRQSNP